MHDIKVRVWNKELGTMFYQDRQGSEEAKALTRWLVDFPDEYIKMLYTNLKDIKGQPIYAGDIVSYTGFRGNHTVASSKHDGYVDGFVGVIVWDEYHGWKIDTANKHNAAILKQRPGERSNKTDPYVYAMKSIESKYLKAKVMGNIYDNEELINV